MSEPTVEALSAALRELIEPAHPADGDCLVWTARITQHLKALGFDAASATVWGWMDHPARLLAFAHEATVCGELVVDFTARQFHPDLPARWIAPVDEYATALADAALVERVEVTRHNEGPPQE